MTEVVADEARAVVRVSCLLRLAALLTALLTMVDERLTAGAAAGIVFLALTSMAGIASPVLPGLLLRHPILVVLDGLVVTGVMVALGAGNPLVLAALSSCVVIGVLLAPAAAALSTATMVCGYLLAALRDGGPVAEGATFLTVGALPFTFAGVVVLGQAFRASGERTRRAERAVADLVGGAAAADERARLARELHDSTAKTLQGLALGARSLTHWVDADPGRAVREAADIADAADAAVLELRRLLSTLRQDDLRQPFAESLTSLARDVVRGHAVELHLDLDEVPLTAPGVRYELLAAAGECLRNAVAHSGAARVDVRLRRRGDDVVVEVHDAGRGFDPDALAQSEADGHYGVRGCGERLALVGGSAEVVSQPGRGTRARLVVPAHGLQEVPLARAGRDQHGSADVAGRLRPWTT